MLETYKIACVCCNKEYELQLDPEKVERWRGGELIQNVFPELSVGYRELMISNICPECFKGMFGEDEDDE